MGFFILYILFIFFGLIVYLAFGPAAVLVYGVIFVFICLSISEVSKTRTPEGKKQIQKQLKKEKKIEEYWGTIDYWENK